MPRLATLLIAIACASLPVSAQNRISARILFQPNNAVLAASNDSALRTVHDFLVSKEAITLMRIEGHVDAGDGAADAQTLSGQRALAVARWLVASGIACKRLVAVGFGSTKPIVAAADPAHASLNTRIEFVNAALRDHLIGGLPADGGAPVAGDTCT